MECSCDVGVNGFVYLIEQTKPKARKEHKCQECGDIIKPGQSYEVQKTTHEGHFEIHKTCLPCVEVRDSYLTCGYFYKQIWEDLKECLCGDISMADFEKFSPLAQQKILEKL